MNRSLPRNFIFILLLICDWWRRVPLFNRGFRSKGAIYYVVWPFKRMHTVIYVLLIKIMSDDRIVYTEIIVFNVRLRGTKQNTLECASTKLTIFLCLGPFEFGSTKGECFSSWKDQSSSRKKTTDSTKACGTNVRISECCGAMSPITTTGYVTSYFPVSSTKSTNIITIAADILSIFFIWNHPLPWNCM